MKNRRTMAKMSDSGQYFVTRIYAQSKYQALKGTEPEILTFENEKIKLLSAQQVYLFDGKGRKVESPFRLIEGFLKTKQEKILLLSNLPEKEFSSVQIAEIYKNRWQIECFFRFIKQELNFKHYFSRQWNGIQVMTYILLIAAILLLNTSILMN
jgi:IS4 transposase